MSSFVHIHYFSLLQVSLELRQHQTHSVRPPTIRLVKLLEQEVSLEPSIQTSYLVILICFHGQFNSSLVIKLYFNIFSNGLYHRLRRVRRLVQ